MTTKGQTAFEQLRGADPERHYRNGDAGGGVDHAGEEVLAAILATGRSEDLAAMGPTGVVPGSSDFRMKRSATRWALPALAAAAILAVASVIVIGAPASTTKPKVSAPPKKAAGAWQLTATLTGPQFQMASGNPSLIAGATCTTNELCFLSTGYGLDYSGGGALYVSKDGGHTWSPVTLPADTAITTTVSCVSSTWCAVGAGRLDATLGDPLAKKPMRAPELLVTDDGGQSWTPQAVPLHLETEQIPADAQFPAETTYWPGSVDAVICNAPKSCQVLGQAQIDSPDGSTTVDRLFYLATTDAGAHWTSTQLPEQPSESSEQITMQAGTSVSMDCPSTTSCVAVAMLDGFPQSSFDAWSTSDGGTSWQEHAIPGAEFLTSPVSCPSAGNCWLLAANTSVLHTSDGGATWSAVALPYGGWEGISCSSASDCWVSGSSIASTTDAGADWSTDVLPPSVKTVPQISCNHNDVCVATAIPADGILGIENEGSLILTNSLTDPSR
jgi:photosystem II stability/assembly factor-like uncharacterized protein